MKALKFFSLFLFSFLFFSCETADADVEGVYFSLPHVEYFSQKYSVNEQFFVNKVKFNPVDMRIEEKKTLNLKYGGQNLITINHTALNSNIIMFAIDTEIADILSIYESQGINNQLLFVNGKKLDLAPGCAITDLKIKKDYFIFLISSPTGKQYMIYKP